MATPTSFLFDTNPSPRLVAMIPAGEDGAISVTFSPGCEVFIGRFARLPEFRHGDGMIRFAKELAH